MSMYLSGEHRVELSVFIRNQRECTSCDQLARRLDMTISAVKQRIKYLIKQGYANKLRPYYDLHGKRGRKSIFKAMAQFDDYSPEPKAETNTALVSLINMPEATEDVEDDMGLIES